MTRLYARQSTVPENAPYIGGATDLHRALWQISMACYLVEAVRLTTTGPDIFVTRTAQAELLCSDDCSQPEHVEHNGKPLRQAWVRGCRVRWDDNAERPTLLMEK